MRSLSDILDALENAGQGDEKVSVGDIMSEIGLRAFAPVILVPALILVSPLSGIFGLPTLGALFIFLITIQKLLGRDQVWVPGWLRRRQVHEDKLARAVGWLRRPCGWVDKRTHRRLTGLVSRPANTVTLLVILAICLVIPALELLPMVTSLFALALSFFAIGLLSRDGLFTLLGYAWTAVSLVTIYALVSGGLAAV
ncbi:exopolysaccharide biosynthesis protein [Pseudooceanicola sp. CBS1P-1]|uniref:Exopolysaccharide biosynthesis protein n=2 Tax=Paracoccaceae TaxID=31989 RepID=A0A6L7FZB3_9RHOB|nr:exopolysaccharide biosynthesis protein [Pseudooceanicola endophyticus]MXN16650.1 exopolysaccharide biosynthesis protein [Pseudooceanicola albus]